MTATEIITQVKDLPVVSETARKLASQLSQPDLHRDEIVETVRFDSVLTAKLLRVCNSAGSGVREPVVSVDQAILILGDNAIFRMVCAIGFGGALGLAAAGYDNEANDLWTHSLSAGIGSEYLVEVESYGHFLPSAAFTAGLLHDIGKTVISKALTPQMRTEIRSKISSNPASRMEVERAVLGTDHCEVGACLLQRWAFPDLIIEAVANHHSPLTKPAIQLSAVIYLANRAVLHSDRSDGWEQRLAAANKTSAEVLGMDVGKVERLMSGIHEAMQTLPHFEAAA
ncbi:MAG TPA: HDOD domain-containing protein [Verrucomicrobiae bacterium]|jgi:putative nucleotidyltransferase with HDIG domain|nr:HDOD domain-containing protein [Verrucomicrobiae bacterium]